MCVCECVCVCVCVYMWGWVGGWVGGWVWVPDVVGGWKPTRSPTTAPTAPGHLVSPPHTLSPAPSLLLPLLPAGVLVHVGGAQRSGGAGAGDQLQVGRLDDAVAGKHTGRFGGMW